MNLTIEHNEGEDFGQLHIGLERDDTASVTMDNGAILSVTLFSHEAARLIEVLSTLAETPALT